MLGKIEDIQSEYMMGHKIRYGGTYDVGAFKDERLLESYKKAEANLSLKKTEGYEPRATV